MREIKFRAWFEGGFIYGTPFEDSGYEYPEDMPEMMFTGYLDKDGRDIYEGDILTDCHKRLLQVVWRHGGFYFEALKKTNFYFAAIYQWFDGITEYPEVIGNRFENPELLNE